MGCGGSTPAANEMDNLASADPGKSCSHNRLLWSPLGLGWARLALRGSLLQLCCSAEPLSGNTAPACPVPRGRVYIVLRE